MNKKKRFIPNIENKEIKKIKKKANGAKIKCFFTKFINALPLSSKSDHSSSEEHAGDNKTTEDEFFFISFFAKLYESCTAS